MEQNVSAVMHRFRTASRELFNQYFRIENPWNGAQDDAWLLVERFNDVESVLFGTMVLGALSINGVEYGRPQPNIFVISQRKTEMAALVNRDIDSGYWDFPTVAIPPEANLQFIAFFDWDSLSIRDNRYARVLIVSCPPVPQIVGKHALLEAQDISWQIQMASATD